MITKAALLVFRDSQGKKELLFAHPKGRTWFVLPGGKQEPGEAMDAALQRELQEELGTTVRNIKELGIVSGQTPDGRDIEMHMYSGELEGEPQPYAEIEAITWMGKEDVMKNASAMTPMTLDHILPFLIAQKLW